MTARSIERERAGAMTVSRITEMGEQDLDAEVALVELARDILAGQARNGAPRVALSDNGRITLTYPDGAKVSYVTGVRPDLLGWSR